MTTPSSESPDMNAIAKAVFDGTQASVAGSLVERMKISVDEVSPDRIVGSMPVAGNTQPYGLLHGGASAVLAETLGSIGSRRRAGQTAGWHRTVMHSPPRCPFRACPWDCDTVVARSNVGNVADRNQR